MPKKNSISASSVSRALRKAGFGIVVTRFREGLHVSSGINCVHVTAQFDHLKTAIYRAADAADALREKSYHVTQNEQFLSVTKA